MWPAGHALDNPALVDLDRAHIFAYEKVGREGKNGWSYKIKVYDEMNIAFPFCFN